MINCYKRNYCIKDWFSELILLSNDMINCCNLQVQLLHKSLVFKASIIVRFSQVLSSVFPTHMLQSARAHSGCCARRIYAMADPCALCLLNCL